MPHSLIFACRWMVDIESRRYKQRALEHYRDCYTVLLNFLRAEGLLTEPTFGQNVADWMEFELHDYHLTEQGRRLYSLCDKTWNPSFGQGHTQRHLIQWRRKLAKLRTPAV